MSYPIYLVNEPIQKALGYTLAGLAAGNATLFTAVFPLMGLLAAIFILPEVYGYEDD